LPFNHRPSKTIPEQYDGIVLPEAEAKYRRWKGGYSMSYRIPQDWSTPYDRIFNFSTYDFGYFSLLDEEVWGTIHSRLPQEYSIVDREMFEDFLSQIGVPIKSKEVIDAEHQAISPRW
jgi:hypothetical protein